MLSDGIPAVKGEPGNSPTHTHEGPGLSPQEISHREDFDNDRGLIRRMVEGETKSHSVEKRQLRKDRSRVWVDLSVSRASTLSGQPEYSISVVEDITARKLSELIPDPLTPREMDTLKYLAQGPTNRQIAQRLAYSVATVKLHVGRIIAKPSAADRNAAVARAVDTGLIAPWPQK